MKNYASRNLGGTSRCSLLRSRNLNLETGKKHENVYEKAALIKSLIKDGVVRGYDENNIENALEEKFKEFPYPTEETRKLHMEDAKRQICRYLLSEHRKPVLASKKTVQPFGLCNVEVLPDMVFIGVKEFERTGMIGKKKVKYASLEPYIEVVKLKCSLPNVTASGKKKDGSVNTSLELYSMLMYARSLVTQKQIDDKEVNIGASYYFLRKDGDSKAFQSDFFEKTGKNVVSLWEHHAFYSATDGEVKDFSSDQQEIDKNFKGQFEEFLAGEEMECDPLKCKNCELYAHCSYNKPPKVIEKERKQKTVSDICLTDAQEKAVGFRKGYARINAGAGAGKTLVSALRVAFMLTEGVKPEEICMLTFTNTGADEMRERVKLYVEDFGCDADVSKLVSTTFNSFGDKIVKDNYDKLGYSQPPRLIDEIERSMIVTKLLKENRVDGLDYRNFKTNLPYVHGAHCFTKRAFDIIKRDSLGIGDEKALKNALEDWQFAVSSDAAYPQLITLFFQYDEILHEKNLIEYADQELLIMELLKLNPYYFEDYGYKHIMVDEFQDTNETQFNLLLKLIDSPTFESFMIVGDDSQSIFAFRGSTPEFIINFYDKLGREGEDFYLLENHRSTPQIIDFANKINALNVHRVLKDLIATREPGKPVDVEGFWNKDSEIHYAISILKKRHDQGMAYEDMAYIAFTKAELMKMGTACTEAGIPWIMLNPEPMLENSRVLAALELAHFFKDQTATKAAFTYLNCRDRNAALDLYTDEQLVEQMELLKKEVDRIYGLGYPENVDTFLEMLKGLDEDDELYESFVETVSKKNNSMDELLEYMEAYAEYGDSERQIRTKDYPGVVLTTAHSSKGMEWPLVINSITKYHPKKMSADEKEERRRLLFVSATRARDELHITGQKVAYGDKKNRTYNAFLVECYQILGKEFSIEEPVKTGKTA